MKIKDIHKSSGVISRFLRMALSVFVTMTAFLPSSVTYAQGNSVPQAIKQLSANLKKMEKAGMAKGEGAEEQIMGSLTNEWATPSEAISDSTASCTV